MTCSIRKWKMSDAADLAAAISNKKVQRESQGRIAVSLHRTGRYSVYLGHAFRR